MNRFTILFLRGTLTMIILFVYFYGWRPVRSAITQHVVYPQLEETQKQNKTEAYSIEKDDVALWISFEWGHQTKTIQYRPQAGFFFLISLIVLLFITFNSKWYLLLTGLHVLATAGITTLLIGSKGGWLTGFVLVDFLGTYLIPALTLAITAWAIATERKIHTDH